jgi:DNA invertase Pin-like site-specific DNA recombinase
VLPVTCWWSRSLHDLVVIAADLKGRDVGLKILTGEGAAADTTRPQGRTVFGILAVMAEFEREMISERTVAGMQAAKRRGRHVGRPPKLTSHQVAHARQLMAEGKESQAGAAALLNVGVATLRRHLKQPDDLGGSTTRGKRSVSARAGKRGNGRAF